MPVNEPFVPGALLLITLRVDLQFTARIYADQQCYISRAVTGANTGACIAVTPHELFDKVLYIVFDDGRHGWVPEAYVDDVLD